jgi:hypothetical protein
MTKPQIKYIKRLYKYALAETYAVLLDKGPDVNIEIEFIQYDTSGLLTIKEGYAWDGPSGPTIDTKDFMRGSLVHDVFYQLMREKYLDQSWKDYADKLLKRICIADGMYNIRAEMVYEGVQHFAGYASKPQKPEILTAP